MLFPKNSGIKLGMGILFSLPANLQDKNFYSNAAPMEK
jgi:hypothetical protein